MARPLTFYVGTKSVNGVLMCFASFETQHKGVCKLLGFKPDGKAKKPIAYRDSFDLHDCRKQSTTVPF